MFVISLVNYSVYIIPHIIQLTLPLGHLGQQYPPCRSRGNGLVHDNCEVKGHSISLQYDSSTTKLMIIKLLS